MATATKGFWRIFWHVGGPTMVKALMIGGAVGIGTAIVVEDERMAPKTKGALIATGSAACLTGAFMAGANTYSKQLAYAAKEVAEKNPRGVVKVTFDGSQSYIPGFIAATITKDMVLDAI